MAIKSNNTQGNPYHDEGSGEFTSPNNGNGSSNAIVNKIKIKPGANLSNFAQSIKNLEEKEQPSAPIFSSGEIDTNTPLTFPTSIQDAEMQGSRILGLSDVVGYASDTSLEVAHSFNQALFTICKDFPQLFNKEKLYLYGTENKKEFKTIDYMSTVNSILSEPVYQNKLNELKMSGSTVGELMSITLPMLEKSFKTTNLKKGNGGISTTFAMPSTNISINSIVKFNSIYSKNLQKWSDNYQSSFDVGHFLPIGDKNVAYMAAVHELGHCVFYQLNSLMDYNEKQKFNSMFKNLDVLQWQKQISGYSTLSRHEHIAEAFSDVYCNGQNATQHNKDVVNLMKDIYDRVYAG